MAAHEMNIEGLTPAVIIRFGLLIAILMVTSASIRLTNIHHSFAESKLFRILNYVSLISAFIFSPLNGLLIGFIYFHFSDWPMNISAQNVGINTGFISFQMLIFFLVPIITVILARIRWNPKKDEG